MIRKRILLSQNFFRDRNLVRTIILATSITKSDSVYEIGPGEGILTRELAAVAGKVVAIEKDPALVKFLESRLEDVGNIEVREADFLRYEIKDTEYKVFSNIPFNITSEIIRKLLYAKTPPIDSYLVMQEEAASKFSGTPKETEFSVLVKPWFVLTIIRKFRRTDFEPVPSVDVVLLNIKKRDKPLISRDNTANYRKFVKLGFEAWKKDLVTAYKRLFTYEQWKRLSRDLGFAKEVTSTQLTFEQWLGIFERFMKIVPDSKRVPFLKN